jgi:hypothetical protein
MAATTLEEYLVHVGFSVDLLAQARFMEMTGVIGKRMIGLGAFAVEAAAKVAASIDDMTEKYRSLYYLSAATKEPIQGLQAFSFAATQVGMSVGQAQGAISRWSLAMQSMPGLDILMEGMGIKRGMSVGEQIDALAAKAKYALDTNNKMYLAILGQISSLTGIGLDELRQYAVSLPARQKAERDLAERQKEFGFNAEDAGKKSDQFQQSLGRLGMTLTTLKESWMAGLIEPIGQAIDKVDEFVRALNALKPSEKQKDILRAAEGYLPGTPEGREQQKQDLHWLIRTIIGPKAEAGWIRAFGGEATFAERFGEPGKSESATSAAASRVMQLQGRTAGLDADFSARLNSALAAMPPELGGFKVGSGFRTHAEQAALYAQKPGLAAPPFHSKHELGGAADIEGSEAAKAWLHAHAGEFGLRFPMSHEPWHVEPMAGFQGNVAPAGGGWTGGPRQNGQTFNINTTVNGAGSDSGRTALLVEQTQRSFWSDVLRYSRPVDSPTGGPS